MPTSSRDRIGFQWNCPSPLRKHVNCGQQKSISVVISSDNGQIDQISLNEIGYSLAVDLLTFKFGSDRLVQSIIVLTEQEIDHVTSRFTTVTSCRLDTRITARKLDIAVQIFQLAIMLSVPIGWCRFFFDFGLAFYLGVGIFFVGEIVFLFSVLAFCGHLHHQCKQTARVPQVIPVVAKGSVPMVVVVTVVVAASVRSATGISFC